MVYVPVLRATLNLPGCSYNPSVCHRILLMSAASFVSLRTLDYESTRKHFHRRANSRPTVYTIFVSLESPRCKESICSRVILYTLLYIGSDEPCTWKVLETFIPYRTCPYFKKHLEVSASLTSMVGAIRLQQKRNALRGMVRMLTSSHGRASACTTAVLVIISKCYQEVALSRDADA